MLGGALARESLPLGLEVLLLGGALSGEGLVLGLEALELRLQVAVALARLEAIPLVERLDRV